MFVKTDSSEKFLKKPIIGVIPTSRTTQALLVRDRQYSKTASYLVYIYVPFIRTYGAAFTFKAISHEEALRQAGEMYDTEQQKFILSWKRTEMLCKARELTFKILDTEMLMAKPHNQSHHAITALCKSVTY